MYVVCTHAIRTYVSMGACTYCDGDGITSVFQPFSSSYLQVCMWSGGSEWVSAYMYVCMYILCMVQSCFKVSSSVRTLHTAITQVSEVL